MATVQVQASTTQAVGAFDRLERAINGAQRAMTELRKSSEDSRASIDRLGTSVPSVSNIRGAFDSLVSTLHNVFSWLERVGVGVQLVFKSLLTEIDKIQGFNAIMSVSTGEAKKAAESYDFLRRTADVLGLRFDSLAGNYAKLVAAIPDGNDKLAIAEKVFLGVSMAARTLHASNQDTQLMFYAVTQMASKGTVSMEELRRQLAEKLPGALQIAAKSLNTTTNELETAIRKGMVDSAKFLPIFGEALIGTFAKSSETASNSVSAAINRLSNVWVDFTKQVLDSGAGMAVAGIFDAIRDKLSDPYVITRFAEAVKDIATRLTDMVKNLTAEDLHRGFDTFAKGMSIVITLVDKLVSALSWMIDNSGKAGAVIGGIVGAVQGAAIGSMIAPGAGTLIGAGVGLVGGASLGGYAGSSLSPSGEELARQRQAEEKARRLAMEAQAQQRRIAEQYIEPLLKSANVSVLDASQLFSPDRLNQSTVDTIVRILGDKKYAKKPDALQKAIIGYAQTGYVMSGDTHSLKDVLGGKPGKLTPEEKALNRQMWEGFGFQGNFKEEWDRLGELYKSKRIDINALEEAQARLLKQQPIIREHMKLENKDLQSSNKALEANIDYVVKLLEARDEFVKHNQDFIEALHVQQASVGLSARQSYVNDGLRDFDLKSQTLLDKASNPYEKSLLEKSISSEREQRRKALGETFDYLHSAAAGLSTAYAQFFDDIQNRGQQAAEAFTTFVGGMQEAWTNFVMTGKLDFKGFIGLIQTEIAKVSWNKFIAPAAAGAANWLTGLFFADGGIMTSQGSMPLKKYSTGGIATSPQVAMFGEGSMNEAYIPLPDGRTVPVSFRGGNGQGAVHIYQNIVVGSNVSRSEVAAAAMTAKTAAVNEVRQLVARRGSL